MNGSTTDGATAKDLSADLLLIQQAMRRAPTQEALGFLLVNDSARLVSYRTAVLWGASSGKGRLRAVSGIPEPAANAPFSRWATQLCAHLTATQGEGPCVLTPQCIPANLLQEWQEFLPQQAIWLPLMGGSGEALGGLLLAREEPWREEEQGVLAYHVAAAGHAWEALQNRPRPFLAGLRRRRSWAGLLAAALAIALLWLPVSQSVLAPAEVVPSRPAIIRAPLDGVVGKVHVESNQPVTAGMDLLELDATSLYARLDVAAQELEIARAEYRRTEQASVTDRAASSRLPILQARIEQREADLAYVQSMLERTRLRAQQDGLAIVPDIHELEGKPVKLGQKLLTLAEPQAVELEFWLGVGDSIPLPEQARVELFLNVAPESPLSARLRSINYQAELAPEGNLAFRGRAELAGEMPLPRIGWRGTAKLYGARVPLYYYLFRRPVAALRQWTGL